MGMSGSDEDKTETRAPSQAPHVQPPVYGYYSPYGFPAAQPFAYPLAYYPQQYVSEKSVASKVNKDLPPSRVALPGGVPPWRQSDGSHKVSKIHLNLPVAVAEKKAPGPPTAGPPSASAPCAAWPPSLKAYVEKCFAACKNDAERDRMEEFLRVKINESIKCGAMSTQNWAQEQVPFGHVAQSPAIPKRSSVSAACAQDTVDSSKKDARMKRFFSGPDHSSGQASVSRKKPKTATELGEASGFSDVPIVGKCELLEKSYFRLTAAPDPSVVRPPHILQKSFELVLDKWRSGSEYHYICDQLKSIRQDLTVQNIRSEFSVKVYEAHARIALQFADLGEYNQCQSQLKTLYSSGISGEQSEFISYRILYLLITENLTELNNELHQLCPRMKDSKHVQLALKVHSSILSLNVSEFFGSLQSCSVFCRYILRPLIVKLRTHYLSSMLRPLKSRLTVDSLVRLLGFATPSEFSEFVGDSGLGSIENGCFLLKAG